MHVLHDPDEFVVEHEHCTCIRSNAFPWCTCGRGGFKTRKATPEEYKRNRQARLNERAKELREELAAVESELNRT